MVNKYNLIKGNFYQKKLDLVLFLAYNPLNIVYFPSRIVENKNILLLKKTLISWDSFIFFKVKNELSFFQER